MKKTSDLQKIVKTSLNCRTEVTFDVERKTIVPAYGEHNHDSELLWVKVEAMSVCISVARRIVKQVLQECNLGAEAVSSRKSPLKV